MGRTAERPLSSPAPEAAWSAALLPLLESARVRLLLSGTLERADGQRILWLPYRRAGRGRDEVDLGVQSRGGMVHL